MKVGYSFESLVKKVLDIDASAVHKTGNETIAGLKTFSTCPVSTGAQGTGGDALTRRDFVQAELNKKLNLSGGTVTGNLTVQGISSFATGLKVGGQDVIGVVGPLVRLGGVAYDSEMNLSAKGGLIYVCPNWNTRYRVFHQGFKPTAADVGALPSNGNAVSATKLQTARLIGGVGFDGTANINLPGVNTAGNQSTSGNAATATKLQTVRSINGTNFDGTGNITTAKWGSARNIYINGVMKTVDGGADVIWGYPESAMHYIGTTHDPKSGAILIAEKYVGTLKNLQGFAGRIYCSRGDVRAAHQMSYIDVVITTAYNANRVELIDMSLNGRNMDIREVTYQGKIWYAVYLTAGSSSTLWSHGKWYSEPVFVNNADGLPTTVVANKPTNYSARYKPTPADIGALANDANAVSATKLQTARNINNVAFDGTKDVTISSLFGHEYTSGGADKPNFFGPGCLKYRMLGAKSGSAGEGLASGYVDALWISSYVGADVKGSNVLMMSKDSARIGFRQQNFDATAWGPLYEIYHTGKKPTLNELGAFPTAGGTAAYFLPTNTVGAGKGLVAGNGDNATLNMNNIRIESWFGVGIWGTQGTPGYSHSFDSRGGHTRAKGDYYAQTDKRVYHEGFKPTSNDVGLGNVPNTPHNIEAQINTVPIRDGSGDIKARLFRSSYGSEVGISAGASMAFRTGGGDDYIRFCNSPAAIRGWLGLGNIDNHRWTKIASGACNIGLRNGRNEYAGRFSTGESFPSREFDQGRYRIVLKTTGSVSTGNAGAVWWSVRGEIFPVQKWSGTSLQVEVYTSGDGIQAGKVDAWELYEWK